MLTALLSSLVTAFIIGSIVLMLAAAGVQFSKDWKAVTMFVTGIAGSWLLLIAIVAFVIYTAVN